MSKIYDLGFQDNVVAFIKPLPKDKTKQECIEEAERVNKLNAENAGAMQIPVLHHIFETDDESVMAVIEYAMRIQESARRVSLKSISESLTNLEGLCEEFGGDLGCIKLEIANLRRIEKAEREKKIGPGKPLCAHCDNTGCGAFPKGPYTECEHFEELKID